MRLHDLVDLKIFAAVTGGLAVLWAVLRFVFDLRFAGWVVLLIAVAMLVNGFAAEVEDRDQARRDGERPAP